MGFSTFLTEYNRLGAICGDTSAAAQTRYKEMINEAIMSIVAAHDWVWLKNPFSDAFNTEAVYQTGTVSATVGSTAITGSGALWTTAGYSTAAGKYEILIGDEVYGVTLGSDNNGTLSRAAVATATAVSYKVFRRVYALAARMRSVEAAWLVTTPRWPLAIASGLQLATRTSTTPAPGNPEVMGFTNIDSSDVSQVILDPPPSSIQSIYYTGFQEVAALTGDTSVIPLPPRFQTAFHKLVDHLLWKMRADTRAAACLKEFGLFLEDLVVKDDPSQGELDKGTLSPQFFRWGTDRGSAPSRSGRF